ncbi:enterochelin esterase domain-containing protein, partial [Serratia marcescens]
MHSLHADGLVLNLLQRPDLGGEDWWRQVAELGTPLVESLPAAQVRVTFFWRDPWGDERRSPIKKVYVDINCVTDHHSPSPQSLERRPGSDIW